MRTCHSTSSLRRSDRHQRWTWIWIAALLFTAAAYEVASHAGPVYAADSVTEGAPESPTDATDHPADEHAGGHEDPVAPVLVGIVVILLLAKIGGDLFERVGMPAVLGELVVGVVLGNLPLLLGTDALERYFDLQVATQFALEHGENPAFNTAAMLKILASIGVILLLFEVGLESTVREVMSVGVSSLIVAVLGVVAPMVLGYLAGAVLIPDAGWQVHIFIGATLCATSVGITARVLKDLGRSQDPESRIILGAAVIDDVLGLIVLAVVSGIIVAQNNPDQELNVLSLVKIVVLAFGFLAGALLLGALQFPRTVFTAASFLRGQGLLVITALVICFGFSFIANLVGLAPIIGAFAAGLILENTHYRERNRWENRHLEDALAPLTALLVPIFFVEMGVEVNLSSFQDRSVWGLAAAITVMAVVGKQVCAWGVREPGLNRVAVGLGMVPRGEVGLIFANEGRKLITDGKPVVDDGTYSAVVVMVMLTTMITPPLLKWSMFRKPPSTIAEPEPSPPDQ